jgi:hypothetical protein
VLATGWDGPGSWRSRRSIIEVLGMLPMDPGCGGCRVTCKETERRWGRESSEEESGEESGGRRGLQDAPRRGLPRGRVMVQSMLSADGAKVEE